MLTRDPRNTSNRSRTIPARGVHRACHSADGKQRMPAATDNRVAQWRSPDASRYNQTLFPACPVQTADCIFQRVSSYFKISCLPPQGTSKYILTAGCSCQFAACTRNARGLQCTDERRNRTRNVVRRGGSPYFSISSRVACGRDRRLDDSRAYLISRS